LIKVYNWILHTLEKHSLALQNLSSFCADNAPVNFGTGERNVFYKLKRHKSNLVPVGCVAHIIHNSARDAADNLPYDFEAISFKLSGYFKNSTLRTEHLKEICDFFQVIL